MVNIMSYPHEKSKELTLEFNSKFVNIYLKFYEHKNTKNMRLNVFFIAIPVKA